MTQESQGKRVVISTLGSFGDLHPYIAIALELKRRGHRPLFATSEAYREKLAALGLEFHPVPPDMPSSDRTDEIARLIDPKHGMERAFREFVNPNLPAMYEALSAATRGADLLVTHMFSLAGPPLVEKTGIRWVSTMLAPMALFSHHEPPVLPNAPWLHHVLKLHPAVSRALMRGARRKLDRLIEPLYQLRAGLSLPRGGNPLIDGQHAPRMALGLFSSAIARRQPDWPSQTRLTGFPFFDGHGAGSDAPGLDPALEAFLNAGEPPVVFTLGSWAVWAADDFYSESVAAARALGVRALLLTGDERNRPARLPEGVAAFGYAPHGALFPRARAVVHQGGIGTTAQGLRAGVPSLVVPFSGDQFDNGARVARAGAGRTLARGKYTAASAERELRALLADARYASRAAELGRQIRAEDGAAAAADALEEVLRD
ncbi:MAG TPA: glycosyltransferase [Kofleriaceae bacterium]|nr:glycosyltransferase [Kofleriaceae bacterium]